MVEITAEEQNKGKGVKRTEESLRDLWDNIKHTNIWVIGVPEEEEKKKGTENIFEEIIVENFLNMGNSQSNPRSTESLLQDEPKEKHIKTQIKHKERILKAAREKQQVTYKRKLMWLTADLSPETLQARREWQDIFKVLTGKNLQPRLLYPKLMEKLKDFQISKS